MKDLDLYVQTLISGLICGVGPGSTPREIEEALGIDYVDDVHKQRMRRDYGLIEFYFGRGEEGWTCTGYTIQVHRLSAEQSTLMPRRLAGRFKAIASRPDVQSLASAVAVSGGPRLVREGAIGSSVRYRLEGANRFVHAHRGAATSGPSPRGEAVWSIEIRGASDR